LNDVQWIDIEKFDTKKFASSPKFELQDNESIIITDQGSVFVYSDAVIRLLVRLGGMYKILGLMINIIPKSFRNSLYKIMARNRYRFFGVASCNRKT